MVKLRAKFVSHKTITWNLDIVIYPLQMSAALSQLQVPPRCAQGSGTQSFHQLRSLAEALGALVATGHVSREAAAEGMPGSELGRAEEHVQELQAWYSTLMELRSRLSTPEVLSGGTPTRQNVEKLFVKSVPEEHAKLSEALEQRLQAYWSDPSTSTASTALRTLLQQLQGHDITTSTAEAGGVTTLTVSGYVVRASSVLPHIDQRAHRVEVVAAHTLILDKDLALGRDPFKVSRLTLVAPRVVVNGTNRRVSVDGKDGLAWSGPAATRLPGKPGHAGQPGGQVLLVAGHVHNAAGLTIAASGGRGGPGQTGGEGVPGIDGKDATIPSSKETNIYEFCYKGMYLNPGTYYMACYLNTYTNSTPSLDGADGGSGGLGGKKGEVEQYVQGGRIKDSSEEGSDGTDGAGGPGAKGGRNGDTYLVNTGIPPPRKLSVKETKKNGYGPPSNAGKAGGNSNGREGPRNPEPLPAEARYQALTLYRRTLRKCLGATILDDDLIEGFLDDLANGKVVPRKQADDVKLEAYELARDVWHLEEECILLGRPDTYALHYEAFVRVLRGLASTPDLVPDSVQPVLGAAYSVVATSLSLLRSSRVPDLVTDVSGYLTKAKSSADTWLQQAVRLKDATAEERAAAASRAAQEAHRALSRALLDGIRDRQNFLSGTLAQAMQDIEKDAFETEHTLLIKVTKDKSREASLKERLAAQKTVKATMNIVKKVISVGGQLAGYLPGNAKTVSTIITTLALKPFDQPEDDVAVEINKLESELKSLGGEIRILDTLIPLLREFEKAVTAARSVNSAIGVRELKLSDKMVPLRRKLASWDMLPEVSQHLSKYLNLLDDALTQQQEILEQLEQAANHQLMGNLIVSTVPKATTDKFSLSLRTLEAQLALLSSTSVLLAEYNTTTAGFRQWAFPFTSELIDTISFQVPGLLSKQLDLESLASAAVQDVTALKNMVDTQYYSMTAIKKYLRTSTALSVSPHPLTASLLVWRGREHEDAIRALLRGEETPLLGAVEAALQGDGLDAVKVAEVQLYLSSEDPQLQQRLDAAMQSASVNLTHSGVHHYRCGRSLYRIVTPARDILYGIEKNNNGSPVMANAVYRTLETMQPVLSPFTTWVAQVSGADAALRSLEKEAARVDAHLLARVSYVRGDECPASLGRSYQEDTCPAGQPAKQLPVLAAKFLQPMLLPTPQP